MKRPTLQRRSNRQGTILIVVVVLLLVTTAIAGAVLRAALIDVRQFTTDRRAFQADRLAEAGLARAAVRLTADPSYDGETWSAELPGDGSGRVEIRVSRDRGSRVVESVATFPADGDRPIRSRRTAAIP